MPEADLIELFAKPLTEFGVPYLITGSVAATLYGETRATHDIDLVVTLRSQDVGRIARAFPASHFYVPPEEVVELETRRAERGHFNIIHTESGLKAENLRRSRCPDPTGSRSLLGRGDGPRRLRGDLRLPGGSPHGDGSRRDRGAPTSIC